MATYISAKGERIELTPYTPPFFSTLEVERFVEGTPAFLRLHDGSLLISNDVYYEIGVEKNEVATGLALQDIPDNTWIAGPAVHVTLSDYPPSSPEDADTEQPLPGTFQLYMTRFEVRNEGSKYLYDNMFLIYARNDVELHMEIMFIASTKAKGQLFLGVEKRVHGMTIMHEHVPATLQIEERKERM